MFSFLQEFFRRGKGISTFVVIREGTGKPARQYRIVPRRILLVLFRGCARPFRIPDLPCLLLSPLNRLLPEYGPAEIRQNARLNALRINALQDSLAAQEEYMTRLRQVFLGQIDPDTEDPVASETSLPREDYAAPAPGELSSNWTDHQQPAITIDLLTENNDIPARMANTGRCTVSQHRMADINSRGRLRNARLQCKHRDITEIDIAVEEGTDIRSIGDGYVVMADWTQEGGFTIAIQHSDGYLSVYKHNRHLYKRMGDRVQARDNIAVSGNSGEFTTGPHLHFELWHNGLAQDPSAYLVGI